MNVKRNVIVCPFRFMGVKYIETEKLKAHNWFIATTIKELSEIEVQQYIVLGVSTSMNNFLIQINLTIEDYIKQYCRKRIVIETKEEEPPYYFNQSFFDLEIKHIPKPKYHQPVFPTNNGALYDGID